MKSAKLVLDIIAANSISSTQRQFRHDGNTLGASHYRVAIYLLQSVLNHVGQLVSGSRTFKLNCRIETRRIITGTRQGQLTFRSNANVTPTFHRHHLHSPSGSYLGRSAAATTRLESIHSWTRGEVSWCNARYLSLLFVNRAQRDSTPAIRV